MYWYHLSQYWEDGWIVFIDKNNDAIVDAGEKILRVSPEIDPNFTVRGEASVANFVTQAHGRYRYRWNNRIMDTDLNHARALIIGVNGRVISAESNSSGVPLDDAGSVLTSCTP